MWSAFSIDTFSLSYSHSLHPNITQQQNGGHSNAYTDMDHTNYFFSVLPPFLEGTFLMDEGEEGVWFRLRFCLFFNTKRSTTSAARHCKESMTRSN
jgi:hypothetical protein